MPLIITKENRDEWLSDIGIDNIKQMMQPLEDGLLNAHTVSKITNASDRDLNVSEVQEEFIYHKDMVFSKKN